MRCSYFESKSWVLSTAMEKMVEGTHTRFLRHLIGKWERWRSDRTWSTLVEEEVRQEAETRSETTYIGQRQGAVAQWV